ncbi:MMS19 nucleotide excision repair protein homolog isoform X4 [Humulus lupulus]|uniref:MMS19 nucleotide excision repair protein homolog isoform X4 n=1 Tax=Humulus lupulus TaxID=3486 RepID=UPI002B40BEEA|nr:MMS19 nucleotide excision repair protein homolog isoform X4 [Humulus lupulus]XP_062096339.1 MMS19 nucleotide excision repair protein homolog isoform X4 [Humulus lupulus]
MGIGSSFHAQETAVNGQLEKTSCYDKWQYELLLYGICEAVDGEKDPHCLLLAFDIIRALIQLFPDPNGPLENFSGELFETLSSYFPIHFTHPKGEDTDVKRDDLARALMVAFSSTPLLEPYVIPLLLEKLSSSLPSSKLGGGYLFGLPLGFVADSIGATIGATAAFILGRTIKHAQHLTPGTADRFGELGIIALVQVHHSSLLHSSNIL